MTLPITAATAALCALLLLGTAFDTVRQRFRLMLPHGDGGDARLLSATRAHGNLAEHAPVVLILLGLLEQSGADPFALRLVAGGFALGRVAHVWGLYHPRPKGPPPARSAGVLLTWLTLLVLAGWTVARLA
ncbi:MAG: MAPEG family protein [Proteobacteria bacterium]|nr:MAPEG family protein [Pseudomonadota bacterium]